MTDDASPPLRLCRDYDDASVAPALERRVGGGLIRYLASTRRRSWGRTPDAELISRVRIDRGAARARCFVHRVRFLRQFLKRRSVRVF